jgi:hypothetical protein
MRGGGSRKGVSLSVRRDGRGWGLIAEYCMLTRTYPHLTLPCLTLPDLTLERGRRWVGAPRMRAGRVVSIYVASSPYLPIPSIPSSNPAPSVLGALLCDLINAVIRFCNTASPIPSPHRLLQICDSPPIPRPTGPPRPTSPTSLLASRSAHGWPQSGIACIHPRSAAAGNRQQYNYFVLCTSYSGRTSGVCWRGAKLSCARIPPPPPHSLHVLYRTAQRWCYICRSWSWELRFLCRWQCATHIRRGNGAHTPASAAIFRGAAFDAGDVVIREFGARSALDHLRLPLGFRSERVVRRCTERRWARRERGQIRTVRYRSIDCLRRTCARGQQSAAMGRRYG